MSVRALLASVVLASVGGCAPTEDPAPSCTTGVYWARGERGDNEMHPGQACIQCHSSWHRGPTFSIAGTVLRGAHDSDDCNGYPTDDPDPTHRARIEVLDSNNHLFLIYANRVGNFYTTFPLRMPLRHVRVISPEGVVTDMNSPAPHGDCNACHSRAGEETAIGTAPGRIVIP